MQSSQSESSFISCSSSSSDPRIPNKQLIYQKLESPDILFAFTPYPRNILLNLSKLIFSSAYNSPLSLLSSTCPHVQTIILKYSVIGSTRYIMEQLKKFKNLEELDIQLNKRNLREGVKALKDLKSLRRLYLRCQEIRNENFNYLVQSCRGLEGLRMQNLVSNVKRPLECLKKMKELKSLTLEYCVISLNLLESVSQLIELKQLEFISCETPEYHYPWKLLSSLTKLEKLSLFQSKITLYKGTKFINIFPALPSLRHILFESSNMKHFNHEFYRKYQRLDTFELRRFAEYVDEEYVEGLVATTGGITRVVLDFEFQMRFKGGMCFLLESLLRTQKSLLSLSITVDYGGGLLLLISSLSPDLTELSIKNNHFYNRDFVYLRRLRGLKRLEIETWRVTRQMVEKGVKMMKGLEGLVISSKCHDSGRRESIFGEKSIWRNIGEITEAKITFEKIKKEYQWVQQ